MNFYGQPEGPSEDPQRKNPFGPVRLRPTRSVRTTRRLPRVPTGERQKALVRPQKESHLGRAYRPGYGWSWLILCGIAATVAFALLAPPDVLDRIVPLPRQAPSANLEILVVSDRWTDQGAVIQTAQPRGHRVRSVSSVESGLSSLRNAPGRIGFVVVNNEMPGASRMLSVAKTACPNARVVVLTGPRDAARIANLLVDAGMN